MNALIIEDEAPAARRLQSLLLDIQPDITVLATLDSVQTSIQWLQENPAPDVIFMDIQLSDGLSFEIFRSISVKSPVIFTTAFDEYAIRAFKVNSVDYLLKPIEKDALSQSLEKWRQIKAHYANSFTLSGLQDMLKGLTHNQPIYRSRFLVQIGQSLIGVAVGDIAYFYVEHKIAHLVTREGRTVFIDHSFDELEKELDPRLFFRLNRQIIVHINTIKEIRAQFGGKLKVYLHTRRHPDASVSRQKAPAFKEWMDQ